MNKSKRTIVLVILSLIAGLVYLTPFLRFTFYDQMKEALHLTDIQIGNIGFIYGFFNVATYILSGFLAERFNTKKLLLISTAGMCIATIVYSFFPPFTVLMIVHAFYGIFSVGTFWSPYLKAIRSLGSEEEQGTMFGLSEGLRGMGQTAVAFLCLGALGIFASQTTGFRVLLYINAAAFALLFVAVLVFVPDFGTPTPSVNSNIQKQENMFAKSLKSSSIWICIFVIICGYALWNTINGYLGTYCTRVLELPASLSSTLSIVRSYIIVFAAGITGGVIMDKFRTKGKGMMVFYSLCALSAIVVLLTQNIIMVCILVTLILSYVVNVIKATYWSIMGDAGVPLAETGMATGIISLIGLTPDFFTSPIISRFITYGESRGNIALGFNMMFIWLIVWSVLGVVSGMILKKKKESSKE